MFSKDLDSTQLNSHIRIRNKKPEARSATLVWTQFMCNNTIATITRPLCWKMFKTVLNHMDIKKNNGQAELSYSLNLSICWKIVNNCVICPLLKNPYLKILDFSYLFIADVPMKKNYKNLGLPCAEHFWVSQNKNIFFLLKSK